MNSILTNTMKTILLSVMTLLSISITTTAQTELNDPLPFLGNIELFKITPDGNMVVYLADQITDGVFELFSVPVDGGTPIRLNTDLPTNGDVLISEIAFRISPDSNTVLYIAEQNTNSLFELFSVPITGGTPTRLNDDLASGGNVIDFAINPDGSRAVYFADQNANNRNELFSVPIMGGTVTQLTDFSEGGNALFTSSQIQITSDSNTIVYVADPNTDAVNELFSVPITGGTPIRLNPDLINGGDVGGDFILSPDGNIVVYAADQIADGFREIFAVPINGGTAIRLNDTLPIANGGGDVEEFAISTDGNNVIYMADQNITDMVELFAVPITGGASLRLTPDFMTNTDVIDFQISSDSVRVVYRADINIGNVFELFSVPIIGGASVQLSIPVSGIQDVRDDYQISPDGQTVVHRSDPDSFNIIEIFSTSITGGTISQLNADLVSGGDVSGFVVSEDSNSVIFRADQDINSVFELYQIPISGGTPLRVNSDLVTGGDVQDDFGISADSSTVVYRSDQDVDEEIKLFSSVVETLSSYQDVLSPDAINLYPNPAQTIFNVELTNGGILEEIDIYDSLGTLVLRSKSTSINIAHLASGVYLVRLKAENSISTRKLLIN